MTRSQTGLRWVLLVGDTVTFALVTVFGFATHGTLETAGLTMVTTFVPLVAAWLAVAPFLGAYDPQRAADLRQLWRPFWAMVLAGPGAAWLRGVMRNAPILPMFVVVIGGVSALAILAWRLVYWAIVTRKR